MRTHIRRMPDANVLQGQIGNKLVLTKYFHYPLLIEIQWMFPNLISSLSIMGAWRGSFDWQANETINDKSQHLSHWHRSNILRTNTIPAPTSFFFLHFFCLHSPYTSTPGGGTNKAPFCLRKTTQQSTKSLQDVSVRLLTVILLFTTCIVVFVHQIVSVSKSNRSLFVDPPIGFDGVWAPCGPATSKFHLSSAMACIALYITLCISTKLWSALLCPALLSCPKLLCPALLSCPTLLCPALSCLALPCFALLCSALHCTI